MNTYLGAAPSSDPSDVDDATRSPRAQVTYLEGYLWDQPAAKDAFRARGAARARRRPPGRAHALRPVLRRAAPRRVPRARSSDDVDILFANEDEITTLYEVDDFDDALQHVHAPLRDRRADPQRARAR